MRPHVALACVVVGCAGASGEPARPPPAPAPPPAPTAAPSAAPSATEAAEPPRPAPAAGRERLTFSVQVLPSEEAELVPATLDVPSSWGIDAKPGDARFESCNASLDLAASGVSVTAKRCEPAESPEKCLGRVVQQDSAKLDEIADPDKPAKRRWVGRKQRDEKHGGWEYGGGFYAFDAARRIVLACGYRMSREPDAARAANQVVCSTLTPAPAGASPPPLPARAAKADGPPGNAALVPHGDALAKAAADFHAALRKRDKAAILALTIPPIDCKTVAPPVQAKCRSEKAEMAKLLDQAMPKLAELADKVDPAGFYLLPMSEREAGPVMAYPLRAEAPCKLDLEMAWPVLLVNDKPFVAVLARKKGP